MSTLYKAWVRTRNLRKLSWILVYILCILIIRWIFVPYYDKSTYIKILKDLQYQYCPCVSYLNNYDSNQSYTISPLTAVFELFTWLPFGLVHLPCFDIIISPSLIHHISKQFCWEIRVKISTAKYNLKLTQIRNIRH